ncbi:hypothetical protein I5677_00235 [Mobilitalea sibirica]|uniref:Uncharacterized protein n=1 Tax=Mobilitalea sibirica TaxID=1462919 RepID=A0A8J7H050_9FIRM|nr:symporter small accessory protein [Mobilitalea sibirica]MBH1939313.1 hypothetical protein [Mobilitalea sibirica]
MFGLQDINIFIVLSLCIACSIFCVVYGYRNWNKGQEKEKDEMTEELLWEQTEDKINNVL